MQRRVLIVDDEAETCELIQRTVSYAGMEALALTNSSQAADFLAGGKFDLVILDFHMAAPDGVELARQVRRTRSNRTTPVILMSDDQRPSAVSIGFEAGASFILYKPIDKERLLKILRATQSTVDREKRRTRRVPVQHRVQLRSGAVDVEGETINMSLSGMLVRAQRLLPLGSRVEMNLHLLPGMKPIAGLGSVVRVVGGNQMGIQMERMGLTESERLEEFLLPLIPEAN
ncbi:MAG TPA: response regulator [Candidatus Dormibacteraeota bacterium]|jgi:DNA-binding response OmpR family regulator|nr:response regulator [Candidatus Dormibacteraeota bacterium]